MAEADLSRGGWEVRGWVREEGERWEGMKGLVGDGGEQQRERTRLYMHGQVTTSGGNENLPARCCSFKGSK